MSILTIDTGYSYIKYAYEKKEKDKQFYGKNKFITAVCPVEVDSLSIGDKSSVRYNGKDYLVGEKALYKSNVLPTRSDDFLTTYAPLFIHKIVEENNLSPDLVTLSLSIGEFKKKYKTLESVCQSFTINDTVYNFRTEVYPQGLGIWKYAGSPSNAIILDIGFNTVDILSIIDGRPVPEFSAGYADMGVCEIASTVAEYISANIVGSYIPEISVIQVVAAGKFKYKRQEYDVSDLINSKKKTYTKRIFDVLSKSPKFKTVFDRIDTFIAAGGGAYFIDDDLKKQYGFTIPDKPEYANVLGFIKLASD